MSFFSSPNNIRPGPIACDPVAGLKHRVAISARRILDSCITKDTMEGATLVIDTRMPAPARFISAQSMQSTAGVSNLEITRIRERPTFARVTCDITTPLQVTYECDQGERHQCTCAVTCTQDVILYVPGDSVFPFEITATSSAQSPKGRVQDGCIIATVCLTTITRIVTESDLLLPTYGHVPPGRAVTFAHDACKEFFDLPLYPTGR